MELKYEMANIHVTKLQTQLKAAIKVSRYFWIKHLILITY